MDYLIPLDKASYGKATGQGYGEGGHTRALDIYLSQLCSITRARARARARRKPEDKLLTLPPQGWSAENKREENEAKTESQ